MNTTQGSIEKLKLPYVPNRIPQNELYLKNNSKKYKTVIRRHRTGSRPRNRRLIVSIDTIWQSYIFMLRFFKTY